MNCDSPGSLSDHLRDHGSQAAYNHQAYYCILVYLGTYYMQRPNRGSGHAITSRNSCAIIVIGVLPVTHLTAA
jgi:hypothetical protein